MQKRSNRPITPHAILSANIIALNKCLADSNAAAEIKELAAKCMQLAEPLDQYLYEHATKPSEALNKLEKQTNEVDWAAAYNQGKTQIKLEQEMVSGAVEGQLLKMLIAISGASRVLEIGSFTGYATLAMAEALPENGQIVACEFDAFAASFSREQIESNPNRKKISIIVGDAMTSINNMKDTVDAFDLVFIDADKKNYLTYYNAVMDMHLVRSGGLICVDNTLYMGEVYSKGNVSSNAKAIDKFNKMIKDDERVMQVLLPLRDGLTLIRLLA